MHYNMSDSETQCDFLSLACPVIVLFSFPKASEPAGSAAQPEKPPRRLRRREFNKAAKWWGNERLLFAQNTEPRFEFDFADLFCTLHRFGVNDMETVYGVLSRIGFELVD